QSFCHPAAATRDRLDPASDQRRVAVSDRNSVAAVGRAARAGLPRCLGAHACIARASRRETHTAGARLGLFSPFPRRYPPSGNGFAYRNGSAGGAAVRRFRAGARRRADVRGGGAAMVTRDRIVVGAHYGWRDWLVQRISAVVMALYTLLILGLLLWFGGLDFDAWKATFADGMFRLATFVFMLSLLWHAC